jgi:hypothetical protein
MTGIDDYLDALGTLLANSDALPELSAMNITVWHHGESDPDEDIKGGIVKCKGVHVMIYDLGGDNEDEEAGDPAVAPVAAIELFIDATKRNRRKTPDLRSGGAIRDAIMRVVHRAPELLGAYHVAYDTVVTGYKPLADPDYAAWRITAKRMISLES